MGGIVSPYTNHFWGNCEALWQSDSPNFFVTANHFWPIANHFSNEFAKRPFLVLASIYTKFSSFLDKFYI